MRRAGAVAAAAVLVGALGLPARAQPSAQAEGRDAYWAARHQALVARRLAPRAPEPVRSVATGDVGAAVEDVLQISRDLVDGPPPSQDDTETEPDIAVDPSNPSRLTAVFQQGRFPDGTAGAAAIGFSTSHDGGTTWTAGTLPNLTESFDGGPYDRATDPVVAFGPDGSVYANTLFFDADNGPNGVAVHRSDDGGLTWNDPVIVQSDGPAVFNDKNWIAVDTFAGSPYVGRIYVAWLRNGIQLKYSDDRGQTWSALKQVASIGNGAIPVVLPNGWVTVVWDGGLNVQATTSKDGGDGFGPPVVVSSLQATEPPDMRTGGLPSAAIDPLTGVLYAAWQDTRFRSDGLNDIVLSRSFDGGATWTPVTKVTPGQSGNQVDLFTPDVAAYDGLVYVTFRARLNRSAFTRRFVGMGFVLSTDGGASFGPPRRIGPLSDLNFAAVASGNLKFLGDYMGVAAIGTEAHPVWNRSAQAPDHPTGPHQTSWSATILAA